MELAFVLTVRFRRSGIPRGWCDDRFKPRNDALILPAMGKLTGSLFTGLVPPIKTCAASRFAKALTGLPPCGCQRRDIAMSAAPAWITASWHIFAPAPCGCQSIQDPIFYRLECMGWTRCRFDCDFAQLSSIPRLYLQVRRRMHPWNDVPSPTVVLAFFAVEGRRGKARARRSVISIRAARPFCEGQSAKKDSS
jgi:hypothetical protein